MGLSLCQPLTQVDCLVPRDLPAQRVMRCAVDQMPLILGWGARTGPAAARGAKGMYAGRQPENVRCVAHNQSNQSILSIPKKKNQSILTWSNGDLMGV